MLARFQSAIGRNDLIEQMVLLPEPKKLFHKKAQKAKSINLIVGYNASPKSHTALDIAFCIAHQTHLATNTKVTVQAVYVAEENLTVAADIPNFAKSQPILECPVSDTAKSVTLVLTQPKLEHLPEKVVTPFKQADRVLWQAKNLAQEWQGEFKSHLRFGNICTELKKVVTRETADILLLGCDSADHPMIDKLGHNFPCVVLGIPSLIDE
ncbi:MAG TPA: universal stress protein [Nostocaceae cyanobacterium]|nr:universal stress protein [Nostocaceae cyanobacterium]